MNMYFDDLPEDVQKWVRKQKKSFALIVKFSDVFAPIQYVQLTDNEELVRAIHRVVEKSLVVTPERLQEIVEALEKI